MSLTLASPERPVAAQLAEVNPWPTIEYGTNALDERQVAFWLLGAYEARYTDKQWPLPALEAIQITKAGERLYAAATERHVLAVTAINVPGLAGEDFSRVYTAESLAALAKACRASLRKKNPGGAAVHFTSDGSLWVGMPGGTSYEAAPADLEFPKWRMLWSGLTGDPDGKPSVGFDFGINPELLTRLSVVQGHNKGLRLTQYRGGQRPIYVRPLSLPDGVGFHALLMPIRLTEDRPL